MKKIVLILAAMAFVGTVHQAEGAVRRPRTATIRIGGPRWHVGMRLAKRPHRCVVIRFRDIPYYYAAGVYYRKVGKEYEVILPEIGMQVPELPEYGVRTIETDDGIRFIYDRQRRA